MKDPKVLQEEFNKRHFEICFKLGQAQMGKVIAEKAYELELAKAKLDFEQLGEEVKKSNEAATPPAQTS